MSMRIASATAIIRRFYVYDPLPTLQPLLTLNAPLLAIFGELDTPEGVKANVRAIKQILDQAGRRDYTVKVYPNGSHNLMEVPPDNRNEQVRLKRSHRVSSKQWSSGPQHSFVGLHRKR